MKAAQIPAIKSSYMIGLVKNDLGLRVAGVCSASWECVEIYYVGEIGWSIEIECKEHDCLHQLDISAVVEHSIGPSKSKFQEAKETTEMKLRLSNITDRKYWKLAKDGTFGHFSYRKAVEFY
jgi:hypothetical protein